MNNQFPRYTEFDASIWQNELDSFVPDNVIDAHVHVWDERFVLEGETPPSGLRINVSMADLESWTGTIFPGRTSGFFILPAPIPHIDIASLNIWTADLGKDMKEVRTGMLVHPSHSAEDITDHCTKFGVSILKPYRVYAADPAQAGIIDFFSEHQMAAANELGLSVVMHLSKLTGPADPDNITALQTYAKRYPNIRWILAHCARAFNPIHLQDVVKIYAALDNVWVDNSAVTEPYSHYLLFRHFDRQRILFGSDNIAAGSYRGKYIAFGNGWKAFQQQEELEHCDQRCTLVVYEQLRAMRQAADMAGLTKREVEAIFYDNALRL